MPTAKPFEFNIWQQEIQSWFSSKIRIVSLVFPILHFYDLTSKVLFVFLAFVVSHGKLMGFAHF